MDKGVRLDSALVARGLCASRTEAQTLIAKNLVQVDGTIYNKPAKKVSQDSHIELLGKNPFVSRGGEKLQGFLIDFFGAEEDIRSTVSGKRILDVGSSTGGFTDCLLSYGALHADCVDVGSGQLHESLRKDERVRVFEQEDIRDFRNGEAYDIIVADVSFIPLKSIADALVYLGTKNRTKYFILIKPQFEVGKGNTKKGIVKDEALVEQAKESVRNEFKSRGLRDIKILPSHLAGGDGNQEYFLYGLL